MNASFLSDAAAQVPFNDLSIQWRAIADDVRADIEDVFSSSAFSQGPFVEAFERDVGEWLGTRNAIGVNSGTSALHLAMLAFNIGAADEVLIPAHTFIATAWGVIYAGGTPVLVDVDSETGCIDLADAARRLTPKTRAIIPVHLYGQPADMQAVLSFAQAHGLVVIEDAAQAIGARWDRQRVGSIGEIGCISFYPGKNLGAAGEAGLVLTNDDELARRMRSLRNHGQRERYVHHEIGFNYRMEGIQAAVLRRKLKLLDAWTDNRRALATTYAAALSDLPLALPQVVNQDHVWHLYVVRTLRRDDLRTFLAQRQIESGLHYPVPLHRQPCLQYLGADPATYPASDSWANQCLSLPLFVGMTEDQQSRVIAAVREFFGRD